jgi:hypothetical protein
MLASMRVVKGLKQYQKLRRLTSLARATGIVYLFLMMRAKPGPLVKLLLFIASI